MRKAAYDIKDVDDKNEKLNKQNNKLNMKSCPLLPKPDCKGYQNWLSKISKNIVEYKAMDGLYQLHWCVSVWHIGSNDKTW